MKTLDKFVEDGFLDEARKDVPFINTSNAMEIPLCEVCDTAIQYVSDAAIRESDIVETEFGRLVQNLKISF